MNDQANAERGSFSYKTGSETDITSNNELHGHGLLDRSNLVRDKDARHHAELIRYAPEHMRVESIGADNEGSPLGPLKVHRPEIRSILDNNGRGKDGLKANGAKQEKLPETKSNMPKIETLDYRHWKYLSPGDIAESTRKYQDQVDEIRQYEEKLAKELENIINLPGALSRSLQINDRLLADREQSLKAYTELWNEAKGNAAQVATLRRLQRDECNVERELSQEKANSKELGNEWQDEKLRNRALLTTIKERQEQITKLQEQLAEHTTLKVDYQQAVQRSLQLQRLWEERDQDFRVLEEYCLELQREIHVTATNLEIALGIQNRLPFDLITHWYHDLEGEARGITSQEPRRNPSMARSALFDFNDKQLRFEPLVDLGLYSSDISPRSYAPVLELPTVSLKSPGSTSPGQRLKSSSLATQVPELSNASLEPGRLKSHNIDQTDGRPHNQLTDDSDSLETGVEEAEEPQLDSGYGSSTRNAESSDHVPVPTLLNTNEHSSIDVYSYSDYKPGIEAGPRMSIGAETLKVFHPPPSSRMGPNTCRSKTSSRIQSRCIGTNNDSKISLAPDLSPLSPYSSFTAAEEGVREQLHSRPYASDYTPISPLLQNPKSYGTTIRSSHTGRDGVTNQNVLSKSELGKVTRSANKSPSFRRGLSQSATDQVTTEGFLEFLPATTYNPEQERLRESSSASRQSALGTSSHSKWVVYEKESQSRRLSLSPKAIPLPVATLNTQITTQPYLPLIRTADTDADPETLINRALDSMENIGAIKLQSKSRQYDKGQEASQGSHNSRSASVTSKGDLQEPVLQNELATQLQPMQHQYSAGRRENVVENMTFLENQLSDIFNELENTVSSDKAERQCKLPHNSLPLAGLLTPPFDNDGPVRQDISEAQGSTGQGIRPTSNGTDVGSELVEATSHSSLPITSTMRLKIDRHNAEPLQHTFDKSSRVSHSGVTNKLSESKLYSSQEEQDTGSNSGSKTLFSDDSRMCQNLEGSDKLSRCHRTGHICFLGVAQQKEAEQSCNTKKSPTRSDSSLDSPRILKNGYQGTSPDRVRHNCSFILETQKLSQLARRELQEWGNRHIFRKGDHTEGLQTGLCKGGREFLNSVERSVLNHPSMLAPPDSVRSSGGQSGTPSYQLEAPDSREASLVSSDIQDWARVPKSIAQSGFSSNNSREDIPVNGVLSPDQLQHDLVDFNTAPPSPATPLEAGSDMTEPHQKAVSMTGSTALHALFCGLVKIREEMVSAFRYFMTSTARCIASSLGNLAMPRIVDIPWALVQLCLMIIVWITAALARPFKQLSNVWSKPRFHLIAACMCIICTYLISRMNRDWYTANTSSMREKIMAWREDWWDWRVLQHLRWRLQMAIERPHLQGECVILT